MESIKVGDEVRLKVPLQGRRYRGKVLKIRTDLGGKLLVVSQPNNMVASLEYDLWEKVVDEDRTE